MAAKASGPLKHRHRWVARVVEAWFVRFECSRCRAKYDQMRLFSIEAVTKGA